MSKQRSNDTALALSGGGVRAMAFHSGVLQWLSETDRMEEVAYLSTVSGGTLFAGLVFHYNDFHWPTSPEYTEKVYPRIKHTLTRFSLQGAALRHLLLNPLNWRFIFSRANILARTMETLWGVTAPLRSVPSTPIWSINGTTAEGGVRFRVKGTFFGDYRTGYTSIPDYRLADAMAISAAFPVGIGPLSFNTRRTTWQKRSSWDSDDNIEGYVPKHRILHLYDGGLYDNLGIEPLFDMGRQELKKQEGDLEVGSIILSDASPPLRETSLPHALNPFRLKRLIDITLSQVRALRVRAFVNYLQTHPRGGAYIRIGEDAVDAITRLGKGKEIVVAELLKESWLPKDEAERAAEVSTTLRRMSEQEFNLVSRNGYETAKWNSLLFRE